VSQTPFGRFAVTGLDLTGEREIIMKVESSILPAHNQDKFPGPKPQLREPGSPDAESQKRGTQQGEQLKSELMPHRQQSEGQQVRQALFEKHPAAEKEESMLQEINEAIREMNEGSQLKHLSLRFRLHDEAQRWMVQIVDIMEDEVIREIPPEKMLDLSARIQGMIGFMVDARR